MGEYRSSESMAGDMDHDLLVPDAELAGECTGDGEIRQDGAFTRANTDAVGTGSPFFAPSSGPSADPSFVNRVSEMPFVTSTLDRLHQLYRRGRSASSLLRLGGDTIEQSARCLGGAFAPQLRQLDGYAGRLVERVADTPRAVLAGVAADNPRRPRMENVLQALRNAESYLNHLLGSLREAASQVHIRVDDGLESCLEVVRSNQEVVAQRKAQAKAAALRSSEEVAHTLRSVVELVNGTGRLLPLPGQTIIKSLLLRLPDRFVGVLGTGEMHARAMILLNEAIIMVQSISNVISSYIGEPGEVDEILEMESGTTVVAVETILDLENELQ